MKHIFEYESFENRTNEGFLDSIFGRPTTKAAAETAVKGQGFSHTGKDEDNKENYIIFNGQKFYQDQIEYDDYYSTKELPRIEDGKLIIGNPAWSV
jgi:hypothetical protein